MNSFLINEGINIILYAILLICVYHIIVAINEREIKGRKVRKRVTRRLRKQVMEQKIEGLKQEHTSLSSLELLLRAISKNPDKTPSIFAFILFSGGLGVSTFIIILARLGDLFIALSLGIFLGFIPYFFARIKFRRQKSIVSNQITSVIEMLIHHYSANQHNMYKAVKGVAKDIDEPHYRRLFLQIAGAMQLRNEDAVQESVDVLTFSIGGTWAKRLGNIILTGYVRSNSVLKAMIHLSNDARNNESMLKQEQAASFGTSITAFATVPFMIGAMFINRYLTRSFDYWEIQFKNPLVLTLLVFTIAMIVLSLLIAIYIRNPENDI